MLRVYGASVEVMRLLRPVIETIERKNAALANQLVRCASSVVLNIAEGGYSRKGHKGARFSTALGSAKETVACLDVAEAMGYVRADADLRARLDSICAILYRLA
jgi:four helix bundle protein